MAAIEAGFYQQMISDEAYAREQRMASGEDVVVGVNAMSRAPLLPERFDVPAGLAADQRRRLESPGRSRRGRGHRGARALAAGRGRART